MNKLSADAAPVVSRGRAAASAGSHAAWHPQAETIIAPVPRSFGRPSSGCPGSPWALHGTACSACVRPSGLRRVVAAGSARSGSSYTSAVSMSTGLVASQALVHGSSSWTTATASSGLENHQTGWSCQGVVGKQHRGVRVRSTAPGAASGASSSPGDAAEGTKESSSSASTKLRKQRPMRGKGQGRAEGELQLPPCYTPFMGSRPGQWTCDDVMEGKDVEAIRRLEQARMDRHAARSAALPPAPTVITRLPAHLRPEVLSNGVLLVDKPADWEAEEVVRALRWSLQLPKRSGKLGHVGLLEPLATGLMVVLFGQATWLTSALHRVPSTFTATAQLGVATDTYDVCGRVTAVSSCAHVTDEEIQAAAAKLLGEQLQVPPPFSAVKVRGRPVYDLARRTPQEDMEPVAVDVTGLQVERLEPGSAGLRLRFSFARSGFPRSLVHDLGALLGCGAHLTSLRRESLGGFHVANAWPMDVLLPAVRKARRG